MNSRAIDRPPLRAVQAETRGGPIAPSAGNPASLGAWIDRHTSRRRTWALELTAGDADSKRIVWAESSETAAGIAPAELASEILATCAVDSQDRDTAELYTLAAHHKGRQVAVTRIAHVPSERTGMPVRSPADRVAEAYRVAAQMSTIATRTLDAAARSVRDLAEIDAKRREADARELADLRAKNGELVQRALTVDLVRDEHALKMERERRSDKLGADVQEIIVDGVKRLVPQVGTAIGTKLLGIPAAAPTAAPASPAVAAVLARVSDRSMMSLREDLGESGLNSLLDLLSGART